MNPAPDMGPLAGPKRIGLRPRHPFVHRLPLDDDQPVVAVDGLPPGITIDRARRVISGSTRALGTHSVVVSGDGSMGSWTDTIELVVGGDICLTPPLGWNSWNVFGAAVTEDDIRRTALALIDSGLG
jgi:alpha-galactosidase